MNEETPLLTEYQRDIRRPTSYSPTRRRQPSGCLRLSLSKNHAGGEVFLL